MRTSASVIVLTVIAASLAVVSATDYKDCGSKTGKPTSVNVQDCPIVPCIFHQGSNESIEIDFTSKTDSKTLTVVVTGIIAGVPIPFPFKHPDACVDSGVKCPITNGASYTWHSVVPVDKSYPKVQVVVKVEFQDSSGKDVVCVEFAAQIVA